MMMTEERQGLAFEAGNCGCDVSCTVATQTNYLRLQRSVNLLGVSRREIGRPGKAASQALRLAYTRRSLCLKYLSRNLSNGLFFTEQQHSVVITCGTSCWICLDLCPFSEIKVLCFYNPHLVLSIGQGGEASARWLTKVLIRLACHGKERPPLRMHQCCCTR